MSAQQDHDEEDCPLCGGTGEVSISKDGTYEGTDYYGCPMCISRERDEEVRRIKAQRDELLEALKDAREHIHIDRESLRESCTFPDGSIERGDQALLDLIDEKLASIDSAIAKAIEAQVQDEYTNSIRKWAVEGEAIMAKAGVGFHLGAWWADRPWRKRT